MNSRRIEATKDGDPSFLPAGYDIQLLREDRIGGSRCYVASFAFQDEHRTPVDGIVWIDAVTRVPLRIEGTAAPALRSWMLSAFVERCQALLPGGHSERQLNNGKPANRDAAARRRHDRKKQ